MAGQALAYGCSVVAGANKLRSATRKHRTEIPFLIWLTKHQTGMTNRPARRELLYSIHGAYVFT